MEREEEREETKERLMKIQCFKIEHKGNFKGVDRNFLKGVF